MKGFELVKREDHWGLYNEDGHKIAATIDGCYSKLSIKNCEAIERGYDLDELADKYFISEYSWNHKDTLPYKDKDVELSKTDFKKGFQKALSILGDKKFSIEDIQNVIDSNEDSLVYQTVSENGDLVLCLDEDILIESLQQTEWDVSVVTELAYTVNENSETEMMPEPHIKLDEDGCLILKRI